MAFAAGGVVCANGYVSGPYCSPTRAGLLTGRYQQRFGHEFNAGGLGGGHSYLPRHGKPDTLLRGREAVEEREYLTDMTIGSDVPQAGFAGA